jgi:hypothetical protein
MNDGLQATGRDQPERPRNFFEQTETAYQIMTDKLCSFANRLDNMSDATGGHQPEEAVNEKAHLAETPNSYFERVNLAERNMNSAVDKCDVALTRLENLGLF